MNLKGLGKTFPSWHESPPSRGGLKFCSERVAKPRGLGWDREGEPTVSTAGKKLCRGKGRCSKEQTKPRGFPVGTSGIRTESGMVSSDRGVGSGAQGTPDLYKRQGRKRVGRGGK